MDNLTKELERELIRYPKDITAFPAQEKHFLADDKKRTVPT